MKFFCEYCGNRIDAEKDEKCPHCLASYRQNESFKKLQEDKLKEKQLNNETKQKAIKSIISIFAISKFIFIIPIIIFIVVVLVIISLASKQIKNNKIDDVFKETETNVNTNIGQEEKITVELGEFAETSKYKVKVEKYEVVEDVFNQLEDGYQYVKFYLLVENLSSSQLTKEAVNCIVDGVAQTNDFSSGYSDLPMFIQKELTVKGTATFEVPINATSYDIRYGDNVTIHIEK